MQLRQDSKLSLLLIFLVVLYAWHTAVPYVGFNMPAVLNMFIILLLYLYMLKDGSFNLGNAVASILPLFILPIFQFLSFSPSQWPAQLYNLIQRMAFPLIALYVMQTGTTLEKRKIFLYVLAGYFITCITTYLGCLANPGAARVLATVSEDNPELFNMYRQLNIGSFAFTYTIVLLLPLVLYVIRNRSHNLLFFYLFAVIAVIAVLQTEYTTALLMMLSVLLLFLLPRYFSIGDLRRKIWIIGAVVIVVWMLLPLIMDLIIPYIESETMRVRLEDLSATLRNDIANSQDGDLESRRELYKVSLDGFLSNPIWGTFTKAGGHSFLLDTLSKYGLIGFVFLVIMYKKAYTLFIQPYHSKPYYGYMLFVFAMTLILAVLNPKDNLLVLTFLMPLFAEAYSNEFKTT